MPDPIAIIGLDVYVGPWQDGAAFADALATGEPLPPECCPAVLPPQELALRVADNALFDAEVHKDKSVAVFLVGAEAAATTWQLAALWGFSGTTRAYPAAQLSVALAEAWAVLQQRRAEAVVLVSVGDVGAGAMVLALADAAPSRRPYAWLVSVGQGATAFEAARAALRGARLAPEQVGALEVPVPSLPEGLAEVYRAADRSCALGSVSALWGTAFPLAGLIKLALGVRQRTIYAQRTWDWDTAPEEEIGQPFYIPVESRPWFGKRRFAAWHTQDEAHLHLVLAEPVEPLPVAELSWPPPVLALSASSPDELVAHLSRWQARLEEGGTFAALLAEARQTYEDSAPYALALVARDEATLRREVDRALAGIPKAVAQGSDWKTPQGSMFAARPLGKAGVAFVYPGAFNSYVGMGRELFRRFPDLHEQLAAYVSDVGRSLAERRIYPRHFRPPEATLDEDAQALAEDALAMIESGAVLALTHTLLLRDRFGVQPRAALGYSLGEVSMLWAGGVWREGDAGSEAWRTSPLFQSRLFGPKEVLREEWGTADWATYIVKAPLERVQVAVEKEPRVFVTIVNLADEVVIAGEPAGCERVLAALDAHALRVPFDAVIHAPLTWREYESFVQLYTHVTTPVPEVTFYSAAGYAPLTLTGAALAQDMAKMSCQPLDFPRLVERVYRDGVRLFVELGPQGTCSRWIGRILRGRPHAVRPINRPGKDDLAGVAAVLAMLIAHRVPLGKQAARTEPVEAAVSPPASAVAAYYDSLRQHTARLAEAHATFLETQREMMAQTAALIAAQGGQPLPTATARRPVYDEAAIREFARGDPERCFGPAYAVFRGRRIPRLPNGDLLLVHRVMAIEHATKGIVTEGATLESEYDVAPDAWFFRENVAPVLPYAVVMELALQPCGLLAAHVGSTLPYPEVDFYFRNLDGAGRLLHLPDVRGKTISNRVTLLSSTAINGVIIQKYRFALACEGRVFYQGESSFGYFTKEALANQAGLDRQAPWFVRQGPRGVTLKPAEFTLPRSHLDFLERAQVIATGGEAGLGCVYAEGSLRPTDWFFDAHFYQDPVMPGSLGVEAMHHALAIWAQWRGLGRRFVPLAGREVVWKYRGQLTPQVERLRLEVNVTKVQPHGDGVMVLADGSLWNGALRIYGVQGIGIEVTR